MNDTVRILAKGSFPIQLRFAKPSLKQLYIRGQLPDPGIFRYLCVVGSRKYSDYGARVCQTIIRELKGYPIVIVSGLAIGIDSLAHTTALEAGLPCVAFPGSGLGRYVIYPRSNQALAERIVSAGGALLSKYEAHISAQDWMFPERNEYMAAISHMTLVIEAGKGSGSLITTEYAAKYGRDVGAVPGSIYAALSYGPNTLMKSCAHPIICGDDVIRLLGLTPEKRHERIVPNLDAQTQRVLACISLGETDTDILADKLELPVHEVNVSLSLLELEGLITISSGVIRIR